MKICKVAEKGWVNLQTIRYYEREGLLPKPQRMPSGYRLFTEDTVRRVLFIKRTQDLGFTLAEIRQLLSLRVDDDRPSLRSAFSRPGQDRGYIQEKIRTLTAMQNVLVHLTDKCSGNGPASECPILESLDSGEVLQ